MPLEPRRVHRLSRTMVTHWLVAIAGATGALALGGPQCLTFESGSDAFTIAAKDGAYALPILTDSSDQQAIHIAAASFASDIQKVVSVQPQIYNDSLPAWAANAILVSSANSSLARRISGGQADELSGQWEAYDTRVLSNPIDGVDQALVITGSDRRGTIFGLYELSGQMGISPWYFWADVAPTCQDVVAFKTSMTCSHGEPHVKYRGLFINDEQPALWSWAIEHFKPGSSPPFQTALYAPVFEALLRMKANYFWPAQWASMFDVDGLDVSNGLPKVPTAGPNQVLANAMGIVMGTSHQEPMARNTPEWNTYGTGDWNFTTNSVELTEFWAYGAQRAASINAETLFSVGMRGNGDIPLPGANIPILENITRSQQNILSEVYNTSNVGDISQLWAMYKEVMMYFASGLSVPDDVTILLADDNWGNLMAVLPWGDNHTAGGGIYYHVDYVGDPRDYKWINSAPLAKMWEQMNVASSFNTTNIWILNVGDLKMNEIPSEYFLSLAYDSDMWPRNSLVQYLEAWSSREFGAEVAHETADIMANYQFLASRLKSELINSTTFSLYKYDEADTVIRAWSNLTARAKAVHDSLDTSKQTGFYELVYAPVALNSNLNQLYVAAGKSNLYATQFRTSANIYAQKAMDFFATDAKLTAAFEALEDGKWPYMLSQPHINYQYWQQPIRNTLPPISFVQQSQDTYPGSWIYTRFTVENSAGAFPGDNQFNCAQGYSCPDPTMLPMDPYGASTRWVEVSSGGPMDVTWTAQSNASWLTVSPASGTVKADGSTDTKAYLSVDWSKVPKPANNSASYQAASTVNFTASDGATMIVTVPINNTVAPPDGWHGFVEGDGYVVMEAAHSTQNTSASGYSFEEIEWYGRTLSGVEIFPVTNKNFSLAAGPSISYDFWSVGDVFNQSTGEVEITIQIGPSLNYFLGDFLMFGVQMDNQTAQAVAPVPNAAVGSLPADWNSVVASEIRNVTMSVVLPDWSTPGAHTLTLWGMTTGVVFERIWVDMGGIVARGYSYLGPPESTMV